jgi:toxin HigB-1
LELAFATKQLRDICESSKKADRELGSDIAGKLRIRLADLQAAQSVRDLVAGCPTELKEERQIAIQICRGYRIVFCANHNKIPLLSCGTTDWSAVTRIRLLEIKNDKR